MIKKKHCYTGTFFCVSLVLFFFEVVGEESGISGTDNLFVNGATCFSSTSFSFIFCGL